MALFFSSFSVAGEAHSAPRAPLAKPALTAASACFLTRSERFLLVVRSVGLAGDAGAGVSSVAAWEIRAVPKVGVKPVDCLSIAGAWISSERETSRPDVALSVDGPAIAEKSMLPSMEMPRPLAPADEGILPEGRTFVSRTIGAEVGVRRTNSSSATSSLFEASASKVRSTFQLSSEGTMGEDGIVVGKTPS